MKILFISGLYSDQLRKQLCSINPKLVQNAPNAFQWAVVDGLYENNVNFEIVSYPFTACYPTNPFLSMRSEIVNYHGRRCGEIMKYCTLPIFKEWSIISSIKKKVSNYLNLYTHEEIQVIIYTSYSFFLLPIVELKKRHKNLKVACIITDLIDNAFDYKENLSLIKRLQIMRESRLERKYYKCIDNFVLLSEAMIDKIPEAVGKNIIIEGIASLPVHTPEKKSEHAIKKVLYTGTLEAFSGISDLLLAFNHLSDVNYRLIICGDGPLAQKVKDASNRDNRIIYMGGVTHEEAISLQKEATLLINPRRPDNDITKYSFPSKTMEYMVSGTPMLGYPLEGIPEEYYDYFYLINGIGIDALANAMRNILSLPQTVLDNKAFEAYNFIVNNKTAKSQVKKILEFIK